MVVDADDRNIVRAVKKKKKKKKKQLQKPPQVFVRYYKPLFEDNRQSRNKKVQSTSV